MEPEFNEKEAIQRARASLPTIQTLLRQFEQELGGNFKSAVKQVAERHANASGVEVSLVINTGNGTTHTIPIQELEETLVSASMEPIPFYLESLYTAVENMFVSIERLRFELSRVQYDEELLRKMPGASRHKKEELARIFVLMKAGYKPMEIYRILKEELEFEAPSYDIVVLDTKLIRKVPELKKMLLHHTGTAISE